MFLPASSDFSPETFDLNQELIRAKYHAASATNDHDAAILAQYVAELELKLLRRETLIRPGAAD